MPQPLPPVPALLRIQLRTLYQFDTLGRLKAGHDPLRPPPRLVVVIGGGERIVRIRHDIPEPTCRAWLAHHDDEALRALVAQHSAIENEYRGPAYALPPMQRPDGDVVEVGPNVRLHPELVARGWKPAERGPYVAVIRDGLAVSLCFSAAECTEAAEAGVETATEYRGRGLVLEAVRAWAAAVQASGRLALYSTTRSNEPSRRVAAKLAAFEYGEDWHLT